MSNENSERIEVLNNVPTIGKWQPVIGSVTLKLKRNFEQGGMPKESAENVINEACQILAQCNPPASPANPITGLVCGFVQSGKTASMTAVSALAKDNNYRIIILLAGVTTNLVDQNRERMETDLRRASSEWAWFMITNPCFEKNLGEFEDLVNEWRNNLYSDDDRRTLFITVTKNYKRLENLTRLLSSVDLRGIPTIIFDDEADQASLNTRPQNTVASATNLNIAKMRYAIPHHTYLQYTATPQAPLLITRIDSLSADFAELVSPGDNYIGGDQFFAENSLYIESIPESEIFDRKNLPDEPPDSLLYALKIFFIGVAAGRIQEINEHRSMLVHPSKSTEVHQHYNNWINHIRNHWNNILMLSSGPDYEDLLSEFIEAYKDLSRTKNFFLPAFEKITAKLPSSINQTHVTLVNSVDGREVTWQNAYSHILVGGEKLGRGYTIKGITVTYMPRSPGGWTADTIQQRARFFGYHNEYLGYCRVYLHPAVINAYTAYIQHEKDMRNRLLEHRGQPLKEWKRLFYLDRRLKPTRKNVLSSPYLRPNFNNGWFSPKAPQISPEEGKANAEIIKIFNQFNFKPNKDYPQHKYAIFPLKEIFDQILMPFSYLHEEDAIGLCVVNCHLKTLIENDENTRCLVYLMDNGRQRIRTLSNRLIPQLFQGRSSAGAVSYPGDRAFYNNEIPTIQIHILQLVDKNHTYENIPAVAVKLRYQEDMVVHIE